MLPTIDSTEPEVDLNFDVETGDVTAQVRIVLTHDECGTELKEANFDFEESVPKEILKKHKGEGHGLEADEGNAELTTRGEGSGRYTKTFYGALLEVFSHLRMLTGACLDALFRGRHSGIAHGRTGMSQNDRKWLNEAAGAI